MDNNECLIFDTEKSINDRILLVRHQIFDENNRLFAQATGIDEATLSKICNGTRTIGNKLIDKIIKGVPNINPTWLLTGEGSMLMDGSPGGNQQRGVSVGGDNIVGGSKNSAEGLDRLIDAVARLVESNSQLAVSNSQLAESNSRLAENNSRLAALVEGQQFDGQQQ